VNGAHDMGGLHGFGAVEPEADEPPFHAEWERRTFALTLAMGATGEWNIDASRFARESLPPAQYLAKGYYEIWLAGLERLLGERGLVTAEDLVAGRALDAAARPLGRALAAADVARVLRLGGSTEREPPRPALFMAGERVRARNLHPVTHTRLPRYVRGRTGTVALVHGCHVFPDAHAHGGGEDPQWVYTVRFEARELWGPEADPAATVSVDAFEPYLERVA
jgi:nitrile hydratase beta subunit